MTNAHVICIVGSGRHVGKTTVLIEILEEMKRRGLAVGTVKHIGGHSEFDFSNKDTAKHIQAGSIATIAVTSSATIAIRKDLPNTLEAALEQMPKELDYILVEGFKQSEYPKIVVTRSSSEILVGVPGDTIAVVLNKGQITRRGNAKDVQRYNGGSLVDAIQSYFNSA